MFMRLSAIYQSVVLSGLVPNAKCQPRQITAFLMGGRSRCVAILIRICHKVLSTRAEMPSFCI